MDRKRADNALPADVTGPGEGKLVPSDYAIPLSMVFAPSHANTAKDQEVIAKSGVSPFTKALLEQPGVSKGSNESLLRRSTAADAAAAAAGVPSPG